MSDQANVAHAQKFRSDYRLRVQQHNSRFLHTVNQDPDTMDMNAKSAFFDLIGATAMVRKTTKHGDTPLVHTPHSRRRVTMSDFEWADMIDPSDAARILANPENKYVKNATSARKRQIDDIIISAMLGNSYSIDEDDAATAVALPASQKVVHGSAGLTKAKILGGLEILKGHDIEEDQQIYGAYTAKQLTNLLNITEATSSDYVTLQAMQEGKISRWLGIDWIHSERLLTDANGNRSVPLWCPEAVGLATGETETIEIDKRVDKSYNTQVYVCLIMGGTRIEDELVVEIACTE